MIANAHYEVCITSGLINVSCTAISRGTALRLSSPPPPLAPPPYHREINQPILVGGLTNIGPTTKLYRSR